MRFLLVFVGLALLVKPCPVLAEENAEKIVAKSWQLYRQARDEKEQIDLAVTYKDGRREEKALTRWIFYDLEQWEDKVTIKFSKPAMDDGLGLLIWRHPEKNDDQWLKLPSMKRVRRISTSDQDKYFAGTDLTYEDTRQLMGEQVKDFTYRILKQETHGWQIEAVPNSGTLSGYAKRVMQFNDKYACTTIVYYGKGGELLKTQQNIDIVYDKQEQWRPRRIEITNHLLQRATELNIRDRLLDSGLATGIFSIMTLETARP